MSRYVAMLGLIAWLAAGVARGESDNFDDGVRGPQWSLIEDSPANLQVVEQNGRLEALASPPGSPANDALYLSNGPNGFRLATNADFSIALDYSFLGYEGSASSSGDAISLVFGVGRDLDGTDSAAISFGVGNAFGFYVMALSEAHRIDDFQTVDPLRVGGPSSGTFVIGYDAAGDDLTLGDATQTFMLEDTVRGVWGAEELLVSLGARGSGFALGSGDAYLDNFRVVPEPATWALLLSAALAAILMRRW